MYHNDHYPADSAVAAPPVTWPSFDLGRPLTTRESRLHRQGQRLELRARNADVPIIYLGFAELFDEARAYPGQGSDWVMGPASAEDTVVPQDQQARLAALVRAGIDFPLIYVAHEIPKDRLAIVGGPPEHDMRRLPEPVSLSPEVATRAVGPVPPPVGATATAGRLGHRSQHLLAAIGKTLPIAAAIVAAPLLLAGAAVGAVAAGLDPIVFGAVPVGSCAPGQLATWYVLASWDWPAA